MIQDRKAQDKLLRNVLFAFFVNGAAAQSLGLFVPFLKQTYNLSYDVSGILISCHSIGNIISILLTGILPYYIGRRKSVLVTSVWMAVAFIIFACGFSSPGVLIAAFLMTGLARGSNTNFSNTMVSTLPNERATKGFNFLHGGFAIGALLSPLLMVFLTNHIENIGWRVMAAVLAVLVLLQVAVYATMNIPELKEEKKGVRGADKSFLKNGRFWLGTAMLFCYISTEYAIMGWLVTYFEDAGLLSDNMAQMMSSLLWLLIFIGRIIGAFIIGKKISREKLLLIDGVGFVCCFLIMFFSRTPVPIVIGIMGVGLFMATIYTCAFSFGSECVKGNEFGCSIMIFAGSLGGVITPMLVGLVAEKHGISAGMGLVAAYTCLMLISIILSVTLQKKFKNEVVK